MSNLKVAIVGGGIGGVTLAACLNKRGLDVHLFEQSSKFGEVGAGIQMTPNAVKVIKWLGGAEKLKEIGFLPQALTGRSWDKGDVSFSIPLAEECVRRYGAEFYHVHRADLHELLVSCLGSTQVYFNKRCVRLENELTQPKLYFEDGSEFEADVVVGADGVRSVIRHFLFGEEAPTFTGNMCYRAVVPYDEMPEFVTPEAAFWFGPKSHIVTYYVKGGKAVNIVAVNETEEWVMESWNTASSKEELLSDYKGWHPNVQKLFDSVEEVYKWGLFDRDPMQKWSKGKVTLLGDAAHPMLPFLSQGAAMAIEDSYVLATVLDALPHDLTLAFELYEKERLPRTSRVQLEARERGKTYHLSSKEEQEKRDAEYKKQQAEDPHKGGIKTDWVYAYDATAFNVVT